MSQEMHFPFGVYKGKEISEVAKLDHNYIILCADKFGPFKFRHWVKKNHPFVHNICKQIAETQKLEPVARQDSETKIQNYKSFMGFETIKK